MEKLSIETLKQNKGAAIALVVLLIACIWVFWPSGDAAPPPPKTGPGTPNATPEEKKALEVQIQQQKKVRAPSGS